MAEHALIVTIALIAGLIAKRAALPPLVGFLFAGFVIDEIPQFADVDFQPLADMGVTLLLFAIGLKLDLRSLTRAHIWAVTSIHMIVIVALFSALILAIKSLGWLLLAGLDSSQAMLIAFALSFSSTVFAVKMLEERGEMSSLHGRIAIGILIMQDIIAVGYLSGSSGKIPSTSALLLLLLIPARPLLNHILKRCGHGELLILAGFSLPLLGSWLFELVNLKGDLGALYMGALLAGLAKSNEMSKMLLNFKDILLVGFFLNISQFGFPSAEVWLIALIFSALLVLKPVLYLLLLTGFKLRVRTATLSALTLNNYSEFGLIVMASAVAANMLGAEWLVIMALALSISFIIAAIASSQHFRWYPRLSPQLTRLERHQRVLEQQPIDVGSTRVLILGMGRIGYGAYMEASSKYGDDILGVEQSEAKAMKLRASGMNIVVGDASDRELWERISGHNVELAILALSNHQETLSVVDILKKTGFRGEIAAVAKYDDEVKQLREQGIISHNFYGEAGAGFAEAVIEELHGEKLTVYPRIQS